MFVLFVGFALAGMAGVFMTTLQALMAWLFRRRSFFVRGLRRQADPQVSFPPAAFIPPRPFVSILKPVCGLDDELGENLESFACIQGIEHEVILSVADETDRALAVIEALRKRYPFAPFRVVVGGAPQLEEGNRKVARLIAASAAAKGDILFVSDSNVRIEPADIAATVAMFADERVGCVSNLFTGFGARTPGAIIESLHLLSFVMPGNVLAAVARVPCVVGKSMAISRCALDAIGGFESFAGLLAEDQAIALAVTAAGFEVALSPVVVRNVVVNRSIRRAVDRQVRWNKIRYSFSRPLYTSEFLLNPLPFIMLATAAGAAAGLPARLFVLPLLTMVLRIAQLAVIASAADYPLGPRELLFIPALDLLQFFAQFAPYFDDHVTWRGFRLRIGPNTLLLREEKHIAA